MTFHKTMPFLFLVLCAAEIDAYESPSGALAAESASAAFYYLLTNPEMFMAASEFLVGATPGSPPPSTLAGFGGAIVGRVAEEIYHQCSRK
jgi:hypothetical protein